jgi:hypothetical protein
MSDVLSQYTLVYEGVPLRVQVIYDMDGTITPRENSDGHGPVRCARDCDKRPGERVLGPTGSRDWWYLYDWEAAVKIAIRDGWGPAQSGDTPEQTAERAVQADLDHLAGRVRGDWHYVGVEVYHRASGQREAIWGIESNDTVHHETVARELASNLVTRPGFIEWRERLAARERALNVAEQSARRNCPDISHIYSKGAATMKTQFEVNVTQLQDDMLVRDMPQGSCFIPTQGFCTTAKVLMTVYADDGIPARVVSLDGRGDTWDTTLYESTKYPRRGILIRHITITVKE